MSSISKVYILVFTVAVLAALPVSAQSSSSDSSAGVRKCQQVQTKLSDYLQEAEQANTAYVGDYQSQIDQVGNIAIRLKEANGAEPSNLLTNIREMNSLVSDLEIKFGEFSASLRSSTNLPCTGDSSLEDLRTELVNSRGIQAELRDITNKIDEFLSKTIVDDLETLKPETETTELSTL